MCILFGPRAVNHDSLAGFQVCARLWGVLEHGCGGDDGRYASVKLPYLLLISGGFLTTIRSIV
jgi:hypothetical protein